MFFYGSNPGAPGPWGSTILDLGEHHLNKLGKGPQHGLELTVASGKFATWKSCLLPIEKVGSKELLPGNSVVKVISGK